MCSKLYLRLEAWIEVEKENSQSFLYRDLMVLYPYVASLHDYIDALNIDHDFGCLNMSEVRYAKRNLAFAIKRYKQLKGRRQERPLDFLVIFESA